MTLGFTLYSTFIVILIGMWKTRGKQLVEIKRKTGKKNSLVEY